jgi:hypothetical protein
MHFSFSARQNLSTSFTLNWGSSAYFALTANTAKQASVINVWIAVILFIKLNTYIDSTVTMSINKCWYFSFAQSIIVLNCNWKMIVKFQNIVIYHNITVSEEFEILLTIIFYIDSVIFEVKRLPHFPFIFTRVGNHCQTVLLTSQTRPNCMLFHISHLPFKNTHAFSTSFVCRDSPLLMALACECTKVKQKAHAHEKELSLKTF